jgi:non-specific serine/threonine protein kinase
LIEQAGRPVHVTELSGVEQRTGDAGPVLDARAKAEYRSRFEALREEQREAESFHDALRARRAQDEMERLAEQLASAVGLGGRDRRAASDVERLRINVQRRIKDAIARIASQDPGLGRYLAAAVKTGVTCVFVPL